MKTSRIQRIVRALITVSHALVAAPVRLPPKVLAVARYVALGTTLLDAVLNEADEGGLEHGHGSSISGEPPTPRPQAHVGEEARGDEP